jgi:gamma-glutamyltranspeptidase
MTADDLADFAAEWVEPLSTDYRGWTVYEMPPNEQGVAALMMLNTMSAFPIARWGHNSVDALQHRPGRFALRRLRHDVFVRGRSRWQHGIADPEQFLPVGLGHRGGRRRLRAHGMNIQAALEAARFTKASFAGCDLYAEARVPAAVLEELAKRGHQVERLGDFADAMGTGQAVMRGQG